MQLLNWFYGSRKRTIQHIFRIEREELTNRINQHKYRCKANFIKTPNIGHPATSGTEGGLESVCLPQACLPSAGRKEMVKSEQHSFLEKPKQLHQS
jgi:hypothetical protein